MNYRELHKQTIKQFLENTALDGINMKVVASAFSNSNYYPYSAISSGELNPNKQNGSKLDTDTYLRVYTYDIITVFNMAEEGMTAQKLQKLIDGWEAVIIDTLQSESIRNAGGSSYHDLRVVNVTSPINGLEINLREGLVFKAFTVEVDVIV